MRWLLFIWLALAGSIASAQRRPATVVLTDPPVAEYLAANGRNSQTRVRLASPEAESYRRLLRASQAQFVARLQQRGIPVERQLDTVLNAIIVHANEDDLVWLRIQPGVKRAEFAGEVRMHLDTATTLIGAPQVWAQLGGAEQAGRGIKVAILDSGIDQNHPMLAESSLTAPAGYPRSDSIANQAFTSNKVIVARNYVCVFGQTCSGTDANASDGVGHGTFVASVVAGRSANSPKNTTLTGVAPGAFLGNYKVFSAGGRGADTAVLGALNDAVNDQMDVINFSGGSQPGALPNRDIYFSAVRAAVNAGVVVVISAGNCGPRSSPTSCGSGVGDFTIGTPGDLPDALTVGASSNSHSLAHLFHVTTSGSTPGSTTDPVPANLQALPSSGSPDPAISSNIGPAVLADVTPFDASSLACTSLPGGSMSGKIAVIKRGSCNFTVKIANAAQAGAIAALIYDNQVEPLLIMATAGSSIPSAFISMTDGASLVAFLTAHPGAQGKIDGELSISAQTADLVSNYSSRGPNPDFSIKPDLVAPGDMYAATQNLNPAGELYDPSRFAYSQGTSFSAPMIAGAAAVIKGARPTLAADARAIKSALVNSAVPVSGTQDGALTSVMNTGAGRLSLPAALATTLVADPVSLSFGLITPGNGDQQLPVTLKNIGTAQETFAISVSQTNFDPGLLVTTDPSPLTLGPGGIAILNLRIAASSTSLQGIFEGLVTLKSQTTATSVRIPYWMIFDRPFVASGGLVDGAGFGKAVAPGGIVSLFGAVLGGRAIAASTLPLPGDLGHTTVKVVSGGVTTTAPLFFSSTGQVNLQLPAGLTPGLQASLAVALQGLIGNVYNFTPAAAAPGIFTTTSDGKGTALALHSDFSFVTAANPARAGEIVAIYCTGLGEVSPPVNDGLPALNVPLSSTKVNPSVTIGQKLGSVKFAGLAPGFVGLYQVNVQIPADVDSGALSLTIAMSGATSNVTAIDVRP